MMTLTRRRPEPEPNAAFNLKEARVRVERYHKDFIELRGGLTDKEDA